MKYIEFYHEIGKEAVFNVDQLFHGHVVAFKVGIMAYMITVWLTVNNVYPISMELALFFLSTFGQLKDKTRQGY